MHSRTQIRIAAAQCVALMVFGLAGLCCEGQGDIKDPVTAAHSGDHFVLEDHAISASVSTTGGKLSGLSIIDQLHNKQFPIEHPFELPLKSGATWARSPWAGDSNRPVLELHARQPHEFTMGPFEVLTLEMAPRAAH